MDLFGVEDTARQLAEGVLSVPSISKQGCIKFPPQTPGPQAIKSPSLSVGFGEDNQVALAMAKKIK